LRRRRAYLTWVSFENDEVGAPEVDNVASIQNTRAWDNPSDDEPGSEGCGDSDSTLFTAAEPDGDLVKFQSIDLPCNIRKGTLDAEGIEDNDNIRLALSPSMQRMFDDRHRAGCDRRNRFPQVMIESVPEFMGIPPL